MADLDLLVIGELNVDTIVDCGTTTPRFGQNEVLVPGLQTVLGSSGAITACGAARLGLSVAMVGVVGGDREGRFVLDRLTERGVDVSGCLLREEGRTGVTVVLSRADGDRALLTYPGEIGRLSAADVDAGLLGSARHVHVSSYFLQTDLWAGLPGLVRTVREGGATVSVDPNWDPSGTWDRGLPALLGELDLLLPNDAEACRLAETSGHLAAAEKLARRGPTVAVKRGASGAVLARGDGSPLSVDAPALTPWETTGAGDSFNAGYLAAVLRDEDEEQALRIASACGALSTLGVGGTAAQATWQEATELASSIGRPTAGQD